MVGNARRQKNLLMQSARTLPAALPCCRCGSTASLGPTSGGRSRVTARSFTRRCTLRQPRAQPRRHRKQELVIFASTEGVAQRRAILDGERLGVDDGAKAAGVSNLPDTVGQTIAQIDARAGGAVAAEQQAKPRCAAPGACNASIDFISRRLGFWAAAVSSRRPTPPSVPVT